MNNVLRWLKSNVFIVIFIVVMIAACVALPIFGGKMNEGVRKEVEARASKLTQLRAIEKTQIDLPGETESRQVVLNKKLLAQYRRAVEAQQEHADEVFKAAIDHNRKDRGVLLPELFPEPLLARREVLPQQFHDRLIAAYEDLIEEIDAGSPPDPDRVRDDVERRRRQFLTQTLFTEDEQSLDAEQLEQLRAELRDARITIYVRRAEELKLYAAADTLAIPGWDSTRLPSLAEMFEWQWSYWIHEDLLRALAAANAGASTVIDAPVKRLSVVQLLQGSGVVAPSGGAGSGSSGGMGPGPGGFGSAGAMGRRGAGGGGGSGDAAAAPTGTPLNPKMEAALNYGTSLTGRQTNPLYDVRYADVVLMVDPRRVPEILDAFARQNFITVTNLRMAQSDPFEAMRQGFYYGSGPLAELTLRLETIWLRPWTTQFMPDGVRQALGVPLDPPPGSGAPDSTG